MCFPTLDGPAEIPDFEWRSGNFPAANLEQARQLVPGFQLPSGKRRKQEAEEKQEKRKSKKKHETDENKGGEVLFVVKNVTPDQIALRGGKNDTLVFHLGDGAFSRGEFKYDLVVEAKKAGKIDVKGYVIPFLAPVDGQAFTVEAGASGK